MTVHLFAVAIGPVQDFIAQARKTRELWHGSHMLSEFSRVVARSLVEQGAELLIPALDRGDPELEPCWGRTRDTGAPPLAIANKILARIPAELDPAALAQGARAKLYAALHVHADAAWTKLRKLLPHGAGALWREQLDNLFEFAAGWLPLAADDDFAQLRRELDDGLAARKRLREFQPWTVPRGALRSSLDGARESVLPQHRDPAPPAWLARSLGLGAGEQLDAIGVIKRGVAKRERFPPIVNTALRPWLDRVAADQPEAFAACRNACEALGAKPLDCGELTQAFPYEASVLLPQRWPALEGEEGYDERPELWRAVQCAVTKLLRHAPPIDEELYVACLVADGDRMGRAIEAIRGPEQLREFSTGLARFARGARSLVEAQGGSLVYAGGDDVLAFVPVATALRCAEALRRDFAERMTELCRELGLELADPPTLSVGLGIGHFMVAMGELLDFGRQAEQLAKGSTLAEDQQRNALAILVDKRSGGRRSWRRRWDQKPVVELERDQALLARRLATGKIYEIETLLRRLPAPAAVGASGQADEHGPAFAELLTAELRRALARNEGGPLSLAEAGLNLDKAADYGARWQATRAWVDRMLIARELQRGQLAPLDADTSSERPQP